jgi:predicted transposase YbfD/YdcC
LAEAFAHLTDQRKKRGVRYALAPLLVILVLAKLCAADTPTDIADWAEYRAQKLKKALKLSWKRMPHHATWRRILASAIDLTQFEGLAGTFLQQLSPEAAATLNLDGKVLRGTIPSGERQGAHLLALHAPVSNAVVQQTLLASGENEISAAKRLLPEADLAGKIVSGDAIFAQQELSRQVVAGGGDYLWQVKSNQAGLLAQIENYFKERVGPHRDIERVTQVDKGHGRLEVRQVALSARAADLMEWPHLSQVFKIEREAEELKKGKKTQQERYGITSLPPADADAARILELVRGHWGIENGLHYRRDVTFGEDKCRTKSYRAGQALAIVNNLVIGLVRYAGWENVAAGRRHYQAHVGKAWRLIVKLPR